MRSRSLLLACSRARHRDHDHADQDEQSSYYRSQADRFTSEEISDDYGDNRIHVCVGANFCRRFMMNKPDVGGKRDDGACDDQIDQREPRCPLDN